MDPRIAFCVVVFAVIGASWPHVCRAEASRGDAARLLPAPDFRVPLSAPDVHRYRVPAASGGTHVRVEQFDIDVVVTLQDDHGGVVRVNAPGGPLGREDAVIDAAAGSITIVVQPKLARIPPGHYSIVVAPVDASDAPAEALRAMSDAGAAELAESADGQQQAREYLERARAIVEAEAPTSRLAALLQFRAAVMSRRLNEQARAIAGYRRALALDVAAGDARAEARTRNGLGLSLRLDNRIAEARSEFEAALRAADRAGDAYEAASAENNGCLLFLHLGEMVQARSCLERTVARYRRDGLGEHASVALVNLAATYNYLGMPSLARAQYRDAIALRRGGPEKLPMAQILVNLADLERNVGDHAQALVAIDEAIALLEEIGDRAQLARALRTKGSVFQAAGVPARAALYFEQALPIARAIGDRRGEADLRSALADVAVDRDVARRERAAALALYEAAADASSTAREHIAIATLARLDGDADAARRSLALGCALARRSQVNSVRLACAVESASLALVRGDTRDAARALADARRSLPPNAVAADRIAVMRLSVALTARRRGAAAAVSLAERALEARASRESLESSGPELRERERVARAALLADWVDLLAEGGLATDDHAARLLAVLERERLHEFDAWIAWGSRRLTPAAARHVELLRHRRAALEAALRSGEPASRVDEIEREIEAAAAALDRDASRSAAASTPVDLGVATQRLRRDAVASVHALGHRHLLAIWVSPDGARVTIAPNAAVVRALARSVIDDAGTPGRRPVRDRAASGLSRALLAGAAFDRVDRWYAVLDGELQRLPLPLLEHPDGGALIARVSPIVTPALSWLHDQHLRIGDEATIAVFADPAFGRADDGVAGTPVTRGDATLPRLPASGEEADRIAAIGQPRPTTIWRRREATRAALIEAMAKGHDVLHVAAHASIDAARLDASALLLAPDAGADDGGPSIVAVNDVLGARFDGGLVVLSGCATSSGRTSAQVGTFGMTEAFLAAGADEVIGALWPVDDESTAALMTAFYRHRFAGVDTAKALRLAQRERAAAGSLRDWAAFRVTVGRRASRHQARITAP